MDERYQTIVSRLAEAAEPLDREHGYCLLCGADPVRNTMSAVLAADTARAEQHAADCPWRQAVEIASQAADRKRGNRGRAER